MSYGASLLRRAVAEVAASYEETIVEALDLLEAARFWAQAAAAAAWRNSLSDDDRERLAARDADVDAAFDGIE